MNQYLNDIYLHYVLDLWVQQRRQTLDGDAIIIRYADDFVLGFQYEHEGRKFCNELEGRFTRFNLGIHPSKSKFIRFGRFASMQCKERNLRKPATFTFLGFVHCCGKSVSKKFTVLRRTDKKRMNLQLKMIKSELRRRMHLRIHDVGLWLRRLLLGHMNYYGVPDNIRNVDTFFRRVGILWYKALRRRSQRTKITWKRIYALQSRYFPKLAAVHAWPRERFDAKYLK